MDGAGSGADHCVVLRRNGGGAGGGVLATDSAGGGAGPGCRAEELLAGSGGVAGGGAATVRAVRAGRFRRRLRGAELCGVLVLPALWGSAGDSGWDFFRGELVGGHLGAGGDTAGGEIRAGEDD